MCFFDSIFASVCIMLHHFAFCKPAPTFGGNSLLFDEGHRFDWQNPAMIAMMHVLSFVKLS